MGSPNILSRHHCFGIQEVGLPLVWKGGVLHVIPTAVQTTEHQDVTMEKANLVDGEADAHPRNP